MIAQDQLPPFETDAEAGALGCLLTANGSAPELLAELRREHFYDCRHQIVYTACTQAKPVNVVTVAQWLRDNGQVENAGGLAYLATLPDQTPSPANFPWFLDILKDRSYRRAALHDAGELAHLARDTTIPGNAVAETARRLLEAYAASARTALPEMTDVCDFLAEPLPEPQQLIRGVLHRGSKLALGGGSKSFKTWALVDLAHSVAHGVRWLDFDTVPGRVALCNFEIQPQAMQKRLDAVARAKGLTVERGRLSLWNLRGRATGFQTLLPQIRERLKQDYALIILDPIYKLYGETDENKAGDVARLLNAIEDLAVSTGAAVAFGAHFSKGNQAGKESIDRISGSGVFARDPDSLLMFTRHETEDAFTLEATLRNFPQPEPFVVRWDYPLLVLDQSLDPSKLKQAGGRKTEHTPEQLLRTLPPGGLKTKEWIEAADEQGISRRTFFRLKNALERGGRVIQEAVTLIWKPLNKGKVT